MSVQELDLAMQKDGGKKLASIVRNDLLVSHGIMKRALSTISEGAKLMSEAEHRLSGTMQSLQELLDYSSGRALLFNPTGFEVRMDDAGSGKFGATRTQEGGTYVHQGLDLVCLPGQDVRAPITGVVERGGLVYSNDQRWKLVLISDGEWEVKLMYVQVSLGLIGQQVMAGDVFGTAQNITLRKDYKERGMKPNVHVEVRRRGVLLNPEPLMFA